MDIPCHLHQRYKPLNLTMHFLPLLQVILGLVVQLLIGGRNPNEVTSKRTPRSSVFIHHVGENFSRQQN